jgi:NADH:ubiquinone oxidoreductase subunit 4 (subunit M)
MANISLPGTASFVGEFLVLTGAFQSNTLIATVAASGMVLGGAYALWLCNRIVYGFPKPYYITAFSDISRREFFILLPFVIGVLCMGVYPEPFLEVIRCSVTNVLAQANLFPR